MVRERTLSGPFRDGFTLVELIIVALVIALMSAIALPAITPQRTAPEGGAQVLMTALMMAQRMAVTEQRNVIVRFDIAAADVVLHVDANHNGQVDAGERVSRVSLGEDVQLGTPAPPRAGETPPVTFSDRIDGMPAVTFRRNGAASEAGAVYLTWRRAEPVDGRLVSLARATGRSEVYRFVGGSWQPAAVRP
jgi:prepilin-type N-terminal cleavage/methylation domain-containing protein